MAITKLLRLKESSRGNPAQHLKNNLKYILNPEKTQGGMNIGGNAGVTWDWCYESMIENKHYWHKEDGSQGFHYVIAFPPNLDVSMETAHEVAQAFCEKLLGEDYYHVYAIHDDKPHLHIHVTFDSVSRTTGRKYHSPAGDWEKRIQPITDEVCKKFRLPPLTFGEERVGAPYETWRENKDRENGEKKDPNRISWTDIIRDDIDEAVRKSDSYASFLSYLKAQHYQVRDGKYLSLKPYGKPKAVRTRSLGSGYGKEELIARIGMEREKDKAEEKDKAGSSREPFIVYGDVEAVRLIMIAKRRKDRNFHLTPFQRQFYRRWWSTCFIRRPDFKDAWKYKKDVVRLRELSDQLTYLLEHDITSPDDLAGRKAELETERKAAGTAFNRAKGNLYRDSMSALVRERKKLLQNGAADPDRIQEIEKKIREIMPLQQALDTYDAKKAGYDECRLEMKRLRREMKLLDGIEKVFRQEQDAAPAGKELSEKEGKIGPAWQEPVRRI